ncbi:cytochrome c-type biogenesis protein [Rosenbergiella australiborealis]|uniref:Cytochrome c-type biogenesis protein n=1 Tax=Rosenbergiella australiborealis TaxID=1544696 RepID=A0ABS5T2X1_9GAMM|nr:cytochrome c-type biogenesis protein [Rosenbergiella australiborealis]MBT0726709.1 cytochrome c-type biogenesis protein CcmH [Rosenbergiella australiborealis]
MFRQYLLFLCGIILSSSVWAAIDTYHFSSVAQEEQYRQLTQSLRCPKCQNNSIADSSAMIAADMREKVYQLMQQGQSRQQIIDYMVARYGNFVTYEPPVTPSTLILWLGPLFFVIGGSLVIFFRAKRSPHTAALSDAERQRLARMIADKEQD